MAEKVSPTPVDEVFVVNVELAIYRESKNTSRQWLMGLRSNKEEHAGGDLVMPGGTVELASSGRDILEVTAAREAREEVGVEIEDMFYVASDYFQTSSGTNVLNAIFGAAYASGEPRALDPMEMTDVMWLTLDEVARHPNAQPWTIENIKRANEMRERQLGSTAMQGHQS